MRMLIGAFVAVVLAGGAATVVAQNSASVEVRVEARRLADGRIEFAAAQRTDGGQWSDRILPAQRYFPTSSEGRWLRSSPVEVEAPVPGTGGDGDIEVRVEARRRADGRIEFAVAQRTDGGQWSDRILPAQRFFPASSEGRWLRSSPVEVGAPARAADVTTPTPEPTDDCPDRVTDQGIVAPQFRRDNGTCHPGVATGMGTRVEWTYVLAPGLNVCRAWGIDRDSSSDNFIVYLWRADGERTLIANEIVGGRYPRLVEVQKPIMFDAPGFYLVEIRAGLRDRWIVACLPG